MVDEPTGLEVDEHSIVVARYAHGLSKFETRWGTFTDPWIIQPQPKCGFVILGTEGSVAFQFKHCGQLILAPGTSEDAVMEIALEAGAQDVLTDEDGAIEVLTDPAEYEAVKAALDNAGMPPAMAEITYRADITIDLSEEDQIKMQKIIDALEDLDDVQEVYHNAGL